MDPDSSILERRRCAIYTRKSMVIGLGEEFNSWETQRAICSAYVTTQKHKGWREIARRYDDVGRSGATLERPELQNLLSDIEAGLIDVVLVYKLDRITRSLLDFLRLMDMFERHHVAFVSITQNFDTSDSMGRLIMNVLLTFAQFEREIAADRLRDKTRLIKSSGRWPSGETPLGYKSRKHMLRVVPSEAEKVRFIFRRFVELGTYHAVEEECRERRIKGRRRVSSQKRFYRNTTLGSSTIAFILRNPVYIGLLRSGDELIQGVHHPIVERDLWDRVQELCAKRDKRRLYPRPQHNLLCKILYDCFGRLMLVHRGRLRDGQGVEYYASKQNEWGRETNQAPLWIRGDALERLVCASVKELLANRELLRSGLLKTGCYDDRLEQLCERAGPAIGLLESLGGQDLKQVVRSIVARVELSLGSVQLVVRWRAVEHFLSWDGIGIYTPDPASWKRCPETSLIHVPMSSGPRARKPRIQLEPRSTNACPNPSLVSLIADARRAQALVEAHRTEPLSSLARAFHRQESYLMRLLRLNYLAPDIVASILDGNQPAALTRKMLLYGELPLDWALQRRMLGFASRSDAGFTRACEQEATFRRS